MVYKINQDEISKSIKDIIGEILERIVSPVLEKD